MFACALSPSKSTTIFRDNVNPVACVFFVSIVFVWIICVLCFPCDFFVDSLLQALVWFICVYCLLNLIIFFQLFGFYMFKLMLFCNIFKKFNLFCSVMVIHGRGD